MVRNSSSLHFLFKIFLYRRLKPFKGMTLQTYLFGSSLRLPAKQVLHVWKNLSWLKCSLEILFFFKLGERPVRPHQNERGRL